MALIEPLKITLNDEQTYYNGQAVDSDGVAVSLVGASGVVTMRTVDGLTTKINRQSTGLSITDAANGLFEYRWQTSDGDTDTAGQYYIEFEFTPPTGGKFTVPMPFQGKAEVHIEDSLDTT